MNPAAEMPWWVTGILAPVLVALFTAMVGGACYIARTMVVATTADRQAFMAYLQQENARSREERGQWLQALEAIRDDLREHTTISKQMHRTLEQVERHLGRE